MSKPARLHKCNADSILESQLTISVKSILTIAILVILFFVLCFIYKGPTYINGML